MSKNVNLALLGTLDTTTPEQFLVSTGPESTPNFQNINLLPSGNTNFIAGSGVTLNQSGTTAQFSQLVCPQWHIGQTGKMLYGENRTTIVGGFSARTSQQISLSAQCFQHFQYVTSLNKPVTGAEVLYTPGGTFPAAGNSYVGGVLLPDGRVFCVPAGATVARVYDPRTNTLSVLSPAYPGGFAFFGGCLLPDGRVFCSPFLNTAGRIHDVVKDTIFATTTISGGGGTTESCALLPDGRVFLAPFSSTTFRIYDPVTDTVTSLSQTHAETQPAYDGCVTLLDGRIYMVPHSASRSRIYNPFTNQITTPAGTFPAGAGSNYGTGGVLMADGRVFCVPDGGSVATIYNPYTDQLTTPNGGFPGIEGPYSTGCLLPDGRIFLCPQNANNAKIYDPLTDSMSTPSGAFGVAADKYQSCVLLNNGDVYCVPQEVTIARALKVAHNVDFSPAATTGPHLNKY